MTAPNRNALWGRAITDELAKAGVSAVCLAPGSRCTPLTVAFAEHPDVATFSHLDERSAAFFALGRARRTGEPTPLVCTSGTAAVEFHPAVVEAHQSRVPMLLLTADRPLELHDSGANQTIDQGDLYGDAVRDQRTLPEPEPTARKLRSLRTAVARSVATATGTPPGPVHLNVPFRKPLEPTEVPGDVPADFAAEHALAAEGRDGPFVSVTRGHPTLDPSDRDRLAGALADAGRGLLVAGPADSPTPARDALGAHARTDALVELARAAGFPVLADPLSGLRFGSHVADAPVPVCGGYDSYLDERVTEEWPAPDVVLRFGASPTSKVLRHYLRDCAGRQFVVDPAGGWREATFTATDLVVAEPTRLARTLADSLGRSESGAAESVDSDGNDDWRERFARAEARHWAVTDTDEHFEGGILRDVAALAPDPATLFVSNSMPVRDLDRFGRPREADLTVLGNRGASGVDGITSTALGAGSATDDPLVLVTGDLAYYHDANGLLAIERCGVDATIVLVNNDGGGIFHVLPVEDHETFDEFFKTPHGLDFAPTADLYDLEFARTDDREEFRELYRESLASDGTQVIEVVVDAEASHRYREQLHDRVCDELKG